MSDLLGIHERALLVRTERAQMIASNLANADTPGYKAKDIDFRAVLGGAQERLQLQMSKTQVGHHSGFSTPELSPDVFYRTAMQPSLDGNTVDAHVEKSHYTNNALQMQATLRFLEDRIKGIRGALRGE